MVPCPALRGGGQTLQENVNIFSYRVIFVHISCFLRGPMCFRGIRKSPNSPERFTGPVSAPVNAVQQPDIAQGTRASERFASTAAQGQARLKIASF